MRPSELEPSVGFFGFRTSERSRQSWSQDWAPTEFSSKPTTSSQHRSGHRADSTALCHLMLFNQYVSARQVDSFDCTDHCTGSTIRYHLNFCDVTVKDKLTISYVSFYDRWTGVRPNSTIQCHLIVFDVKDKPTTFGRSSYKSSYGSHRPVCRSCVHSAHACQLLRLSRVLRV